MKNLLLSLTIFLTITLFYSCDCEKGSGNVISETYEFDYFDKIQLEGDYTVYIYQDTVSQITIEAEDNILPLIDTYLTIDDRLIIDTDKCIGKHKQIIITVSMPDVREIRSDGSAEISVVSNVQTDQLRLETYGSGKIILNMVNAESLVFVDIRGSGDVRIDDLTTPLLKVKIFGSGDFTAYGTAEVFDIDIFGSGDVNAFGLDSEICDISITGSGNCSVTVYERLDVQITGSGNVYYRGDPTTVDVYITGTGRVEAD